eukprot:scaffold48823_cov27-Tisochrysis_lutea.AAC.8
MHPLSVGPIASVATLINGRILAPTATTRDFTALLPTTVARATSKAKLVRIASASKSPSKCTDSLRTIHMSSASLNEPASNSLLNRRFFKEGTFHRKR